MTSKQNHPPLALSGAGRQALVRVIREAPEDPLPALAVEHLELLVIDAVLLPDVLAAVHGDGGPATLALPAHSIIHVCKPFFRVRQVYLFLDNP